MDRSQWVYQRHEAKNITTKPKTPNVMKRTAIQTFPSKELSAIEVLLLLRITPRARSEWIRLAYQVQPFAHSPVSSLGIHFGRSWRRMLLANRLNDLLKDFIYDVPDAALEGFVFSG